MTTMAGTGKREAFLALLNEVEAELVAVGKVPISWEPSAKKSAT